MESDSDETRFDEVAGNHQRGLSGRRETLQILGFLREFDQIRQPPIRHLSRYEFTLRQSDIARGSGIQSDLTAFGGDVASDVGGGLADACLLSVTKQTLTQSPAPRDDWRPWIKGAGFSGSTVEKAGELRTGSASRKSFSQRPGTTSSFSNERSLKRSMIGVTPYGLKSALDTTASTWL